MMLCIALTVVSGHRRFGFRLWRPSDIIECDLMMEIRFDFEYVREYLEPKSFCSGATEHRMFWANKWFVYSPDSIAEKKKKKKGVRTASIVHLLPAPPEKYDCLRSRRATVFGSWHGRS
jgi:hypothetical protein